MYAIKRGLLGLALILICSCSFLTNPSLNQDPNLVETVQALNTLVARNNQTPTPGVTLPPTALASTPTPTSIPTPAPIPSSTSTPTAAPLPSFTPTATPLPTATAIPHKLTPGAPGWVERWFLDPNSSLTAADKRAPGGDDFSKNVFERPFTSQDMAYRPDLDITKAEISSDANFIYVTLYLNNTHPQSAGLQGWYGVELDTDLDGRGNYLLLAANPQGSPWKMENVSVFKDSGKKVGGARPMQSDAPAAYVGYDQVIFSVSNLADPDAAWARVSPKGGAVVDLAFKPGLVGGVDKFLWSVWADDGLKNPAGFDYNDHLTASEAGSPYKGADYPLKALALVDNTCRESYHFTPTTDIPGLCSPPMKPTEAAPPGGGGYGVTTTDVAVTSIFLKTQPAGYLMVRLQNNGPAALTGVKVNASCSYLTYSYQNGSETGGGSSTKNVTLNLAVGQSIDVETGLQVDPQKFRYKATCSYEPNFKDPVSANNSLTVSIPPSP